MSQNWCPSLVNMPPGKTCSPPFRHNRMFLSVLEGLQGERCVCASKADSWTQRVCQLWSGAIEQKHGKNWHCPVLSPADTMEGNHVRFGLAGASHCCLPLHLWVCSLSSNAWAARCKSQAPRSSCLRGVQLRCRAASNNCDALVDRASYWRDLKNM